MGETMANSPSGERFPVAYLAISLVTAIVTVVGTILGVRAQIPEKEKLQAETQMIRSQIDKTYKEMALLAQQARSDKAKARFLVEYIYAGPRALAISNEEVCNVIDPATGKVVSKVPVLEPKDFPKELPGLDEWERILEPDFPEVRKYVSANPSLDNLAEQTQYLVLQRLGPFQADEVSVRVKRIDLRLAVENSLLFKPALDANRYGSVREEVLHLGSLEPKQALRIPVASIADFDEDHLFTKEELDKRPVTPDYALSYGVVYLPQEITYRDPSSGELIREDIRPPLNDRTHVECDLQVGG
jgi:hypothetical protein